MSSPFRNRSFLRLCRAFVPILHLSFSPLALSLPPIPTIDLNDGTRMPLAGLGMCCRPSASGPAATEGVLDYLRLGGRHIDTAILYNNHAEVGQGINLYLDEEVTNRLNGTADPALREQTRLAVRRELYIVTKVVPQKGHGAFESIYRQIKHAVRGTTQLNLGHDGYVDLVLLHWSGENRDVVQLDSTQRPECVEILYHENSERTPENASGADWSFCRQVSWAAMELLKDEGITKSVGVSNWDGRQIETINKRARYKIAVNQMEVHPWYPNRDIVDYCQQNNIVVTAYGSMGSQNLVQQIMDHPALQDLSAQREKTIGQLLLRWALDQNIVVIPGTGNPKHMRENLDVFDFVLTETEKAFLDELGKTQEMHLYGHRPDLIL